MFKRTTQVLICIASFAMLCACSPVQPQVSREQELSFREIIPIDDMNKVLTVNIQSGREVTPEFGHNLSVIINNLSQEGIFLPGNFGIRMFVVKGNGWQEVENGNGYYGEDFVLHPKGRDGYTGHVKTWIRPVLPSELQGEDGPLLLRIVVVGQLNSKAGNVGKPVAGYTDVPATP